MQAVGPEERPVEYVILYRQNLQRQPKVALQAGLAQQLGGIADLALAGQKYQHIVGALAFAALESSELVVLTTAIRPTSLCVSIVFTQGSSPCVTPPSTCALCQSSVTSSITPPAC
jgi:hypothetical protein